MQPRFVSIWYRKTDVQCKNRIDTRLEKSKPGPSQWPFFSRLDLLIGPKSAPSLKKPNPSSVPFIKPPYPPPNTHCRPSLTSAIKHRNPNSNAAMSSSGLINSLGSSESSHGEFGRIKDDEEEDENDGDNGLFDVVAARKRQRSWGSSGGGGEDRAFGEFARAIMKFAVVYECIENKAAADDGAEQRMAFTKNLELQPDAEFMDAQVELEKMKQPKYALGSGVLAMKEH